MSSPNYPALRLTQLAGQALLAGRVDEARATYAQALAHDPANAFALHQLSLIAWQQGRQAEARSLLEQALRCEAENVQLLMSYGEMLHELSESRLALDAFLRVLGLDNTLPDIWNAAGVCFQETDQPVSAIEFYLRALALRPDFPEALNNLGVVLTAEQQTNAAIEHFHHALRLRPGYADCHSNLGVAYRARFEYASAIDSFREAHRLAPDSPEITGAFGEALSLIYDPGAEALLRRAAELRPTDAERHWNLALDLLKHGNYAEGWSEYEWRWKRTKHQIPLRPFAQPYWRNGPAETLRGATILLHAEQGYGDTIQFLRYLPLVVAEGASIVLEVQPELYRLTLELVRQLQSDIRVVRYGDVLPAFDWHAPLMSLPAAFRTTIENVPPPLRMTSPAAPRAADSQPRIGLVWSGNPLHGRDRERSIPVEALRPLFAALPEAAWISLQPPAATALLHRAGIAIEQAIITDFLDTANVLDMLDLVLTVDTAVAHLAATQGVPTFILLPYVADWRWLTPPREAASSPPNPWYPEARIFRQARQPNGEPQEILWQPVIDAVIFAAEFALP